MFETGLMVRWYSETALPYRQCMTTVQRTDPSVVTAIKLSDLVSAFFVLAVGIALSSICLIAELAWKLTEIREMKKVEDLGKKDEENLVDGLEH